jgi:hypothetical protein
MLATIPAKTKAQIEKMTAPAILGAAIAGVIMPRILIDMTTRKRVTTNVNTGTASDAGAQRSVKSDGPRNSVNAPQIHTGHNAPANPPADIPSVNPKIAGLFNGGDL